MKPFLWVIYHKKSTGAIIALLAAAILAAAGFSGAPRVKNVIILIGDGMGPQEMGLAFYYARNASGSAFPGRRLALEEIMKNGVTGMMLTNPAEYLVNDSAGSATQIATGVPSSPGLVGIDAEGNAVPTILEMAALRGKSTGLVSDTRITHATPACFAAHQRHRGMENEIAVDLLENRVDVLLSGGLRHFLPAGVKDARSAMYRLYRDQIPAHIKIESKREDDTDLLQRARDRGYEVVHTRTGMKNARGRRILGLFSESVMPDAIWVNRTRDNSDREMPTLKEMAEKALAMLSKNRKGFFLMVESGKIDWAGHHSDAGRLLHEMLVFDETLDFLYQWTLARNDTLLVVTADHETGGFAFAYSGYRVPGGRALAGGAFRGAQYAPSWNYVAPEVLDGLFAQKRSFEEILREFEALPAEQRTSGRLMGLMNAAIQFPVTKNQAERVLAMEDNRYFDAGRKNPGNKRVPLIHDFTEFYVAGDENRTNLMGRAVSRDQGTVWAAGTHTSTPVALIAFGPDRIMRQFRGVHHSTDVGKLMMKALGVKAPVGKKADARP